MIETRVKLSNLLRKIKEVFRIFDYNKIAQNANRIGKNHSSKKIIIEALKTLTFDKKSVFRKIIFIFLETIIAILIANSLETISIVKDVVGYIGQIQVGLIGVVFTGYALFQALIGDKLMMYLLTSEEDGKSKLEESNESFIYLIIIQIIALLIDFLVYIVMSAIPHNWYLTNINIVNECISVILIEALLYLNVEAIWEMKSFIFNVYQLFNAHAMSRVVEIIERKNEEK